MEISFVEQLAVTDGEQDKIRANSGKILTTAGSLGVRSISLPEQVRMACHRDVQAQRIKPNVKIPPRRRVAEFFRTMYGETKSTRLALLSFLTPGSWTTSGGSHKLAENQGINLGDILQGAIDEKGRASFVEVGAGYAGLQNGAEQGESSRRGIAKLVDRFRSELGDTVSIDFTNITDWHMALPTCVREHPGFIASTIAKLEQEGVDAESVDVIYSQCAAYFDERIDAFISQAARLLQRSKSAGLLAFNGKESDDPRIMRAADQASLKLVNRVTLGGMNGIFYVFKKS